MARASFGRVCVSNFLGVSGNLVGVTCLRDYNVLCEQAANLSSTLKDFCVYRAIPISYPNVLRHDMPSTTSDIEPI